MMKIRIIIGYEGATKRYFAGIHVVHNTKRQTNCKTSSVKCGDTKKEAEKIRKEIMKKAIGGQ